MKILRVRRRKSRFQRLSVAPAQNADIYVRAFDFRKIGLLRVGVAAAEFLEQDGAHAHAANRGSDSLPLFGQIGHDARNKRTFLARPFAHGSV
jgi:hypothetical protein